MHNALHLPGSVTLLAASKGQSAHKILSLYQTGQRVFGENYLQEALAKIPLLPSDIEWHYIGPIQSNKTRKIAEHFAWVQSVPNLSIAKRLNDQRPLSLPPLNICIEVNLDNEASKSGCAPSEVSALVAACQTLPRLIVRGLMSIPAPQPDVLHQRESFRKLFLLYQSLKNQYSTIDTLSMGMSDDYAAAIAEGATMVRIGRALFGER